MHRYIIHSFILLAIIVILVTGTDAAVSFFLPEKVLAFTRINVVFLVLCLFFLMSRLRKTRLGETPRYTRVQWFIRLAGIECLALITFINLLQTSYFYAHRGLLKSVEAFPSGYTLLSLFTFQWGLFPWALFAILSVILAHAHYCKQQPALLSYYFPTVRNVYYDLFFKRVVNGFLAVETNFALTVTLTLGVLMLNYIINRSTAMPLNTERMGYIIFVAIMMLGFILKIFSSMLQWLAHTFRTMLLSVLIFSGILLLILRLSFWFAAFYSQSHSLPVITAHLPFIHWPLFCWGFWICWTPLVTSLIVRISEGRTIAEVLIGTLFLPCFITLLLYYAPLTMFMPLALSLFHSPWTALIAPLAVLGLLNQTHGSKLVIYGAMPAQVHPIAVVLKKTNFTRELMRLMFLVMIMFLFHNLSPLQWLLNLIAIPNTIFFISCVLIFYLRINN